MKHLHIITLLLGLLACSSQLQAQTGPCYAAINYLDTVYCANGVDPIPLVLGNANGSFLGVSGLVYADVNGEVDVSASVPNPNYYVIQFHVIDSVNNCDTIVVDSFLLLAPTPTAFGYGVDSFCTADTLAHGPVFQPLIGGTFSGPFGLAIDPSTGAILPGSSAPGTYPVTFTPNAFCMLSSMDTITIADCAPTSVPDKVREEWAVFPVPATESLHLVHTGKPASARVSLCNLQGHVVYQANLGPSDLWSLPVATLPAGMYFLRISSGHQQLSLRVAVAH